MTTSMREALEAAKSWIERWTSHVGNCRGGNECTCGRTAILAECAAALSSPAPDRLTEEERKAVEEARSWGTIGRVTAILVAIIDRFSRQPEAEPAAWGDSEGRERPIDAEAMKQLRLNPTTEIYWSRFSIPLYTSPRLDRERLARTLYRRLVLNPPADFDDASADLQNEWLQLADAIMRETRA